MEGCLRGFCRAPLDGNGNNFRIQHYMCGQILRLEQGDATRLHSLTQTMIYSQKKHTCFKHNRPAVV